MADDAIGKKLDTVIDLLRQILAVHLAQSGVKQKDIAKRLGVATAKANQMLQGIKAVRDQS